MDYIFESLINRYDELVIQEYCYGGSYYTEEAKIGLLEKIGKFISDLCVKIMNKKNISEILSLANPALFERTISCTGPSKDESNFDVCHARHLRPGLLLAVFKENFNGRHLAFYLDPCFGFCLV